MTTGFAPESDIKAPFDRTAFAESTHFVAREMRAKVLESGIRMTRIPAWIRGGELSFGSCFQQEALDSKTCPTRENRFRGMYVIEGVIGDLVIRLVELIDYLSNAV